MRAKKLSERSVFETVLSETVFGPSPRFVFLTFRGPLASHDSNPYPTDGRIARYNATKARVAHSLLCRLASCMVSIVLSVTQPEVWMLICFSKSKICEGQKVPQSPKPGKNQSNEKVTKK